LLFLTLLSSNSFTGELAPEQYQGNSDEINQYRVSVENEIISNFPKLFEKHDSTLKLIPQKGETRLLVTDNCTGYRLLKYFPKYNISLIGASSFCENYTVFAYHHKFGSFVNVYKNVEFSPSVK